MSWLFRPDQWPRTPQDWIDRASRWPTTPRQWLTLVDELSRSPTRVLVDLIESLSAGFVGRTVELTTDSDTVILELVDVACSHEHPPVAMGALRPTMDLEGIETVAITAADVAWSRGRIDDLYLEAHDVRLEGGIVTKLRAAPVVVEGRIGQETVDEWVAASELGVERIELWRSGMVRVQLRSWLVAEVEVELDDDEVVFTPRLLRAWGFAVPYAHRRLGVHRVAVPRLLKGLRVTDLEATPDELVARGRIDRLREPIWLDQLIRAASTVGAVVVVNLRPPQSVPVRERRGPDGDRRQGVRDRPGPARRRRPG